MWKHSTKVREKIIFQSFTDVTFSKKHTLFLYFFTYREVIFLHTFIPGRKPYTFSQHILQNLTLSVRQVQTLPVAHPT